MAYQTTSELRKALPASVGVTRMTAKGAAAHKQQARAYQAEYPASTQPFEEFAAENGWCIEPGWWWQEDDAEEQMHGPFAGERECLVHCLTWQHVLVNGRLPGHLPWCEVWAPGYTHIVKAIRK
jgi:hypothetical protein